MNAATFARKTNPSAVRAGKCPDGLHRSINDDLHRAASETGRPIDAPLRAVLERGFAHDFSRVKVHSGSASAESAQRLGARAYTLGTDVYLGAEAHGLPGGEFNRLLIHEAVHTLQQGGRSVSPRAGLTVSNPTDAAEQEAARIANSLAKAEVVSQPSRSLAMRDAMRARSGQETVAHLVAPQLQRDLTGKKAVKDGEFDLNLKTESHPGAKNGMSGTIKFTASDKAPDSNNIRLLQVIRNEDLTTGKEYVWTGDEANRNKVMTTASKGIDPGFHVDRIPKGLSPRAKATDPRVSPYYLDNFGAGGGNKDGSKKGKTVKEASLWDYPGSWGNRRFSFETAAKGADTGYVYATLTWGFTISDAAKGKVDTEHADANRSPSATFGAAVKAFNEFYKNPGSSKAP
jgi:hypothetical protein